MRISRDAGPPFHEIRGQLTQLNIENSATDSGPCRRLDAGHSGPATDTSTWDVLSQLDYTLDGVGNVHYIEDYADPANDRDYAYDPLNRLTWDSGVSSTNPTYTYDDNGNRLSRTATVAGFADQSISYVAASNRINLLDGTTATYDGMGNLLGPEPWSASYDAGGRAKQISDGTSRASLVYNGLGELARIQHENYDGCSNSWNTQTWEYLHFATDGRALGLVQQLTNRVQWDWVWIDDLPVLQFQDSYDAAGNLIGTQTTYLHPDHLGTPRIGTDTAGAIQWGYRSDAFGKATVSGAHTVRLRLPGQIDLGIEGLNYNYFRDYDPNLGRYLESDPIGISGGNNTFAYVENNPQKNIDPTGLLPLPLFDWLDCNEEEVKFCKWEYCPSLKKAYVSCRVRVKVVTEIRNGFPVPTIRKLGISCNCEEPYESFCPIAAPIFSPAPGFLPFPGLVPTPAFVIP